MQLGRKKGRQGRDEEKRKINFEEQQSGGFSRGVWIKHKNPTISPVYHLGAFLDLSRLKLASMTRSLRAVLLLSRQP